MSKEDVIIKGVTVKYKGSFDLSLLYKNLNEWLVREKFSDTIQEGEKKYAEKIKPDGKQIEILWETSRNLEAGYFKIVIGISFFLNGINEVELEREGKRIKLENGEIELNFVSKIIRNADNKWKENSLIFNLYEKHIIKDKIESVKIECYRDTNKLIDEAKNFFNLYKL